MTDEVPVEARLARGDASAWLGFSPEPVGETTLDEAQLRSFARFPELPNLLYVHVPHCVSSCNFCMYFHRVTQSEAVHRRSFEHLDARITRAATRLGRRRIAAAYVGGGTPTALPAPLLEALVDRLAQSFELRGPVTVEAHPGTTTPEALAGLARRGVTRLSMGWQTFDPELLVKITRRNPDPSALAALLAAGARVDLETNVDLVVGLPGQSAANFQHDVLRLCALGPDTITLYRYHPTPRLAGGELRFTEAVPVKLLRTLASAGYVGRIGTDSTSSLTLFRLGRRLLQRCVGELGAAVRALRVPQLTSYEAYGEAPTQLIGFGTGAIGHAFGERWYREVTALEAQPCEARFTATSLDVEAELRHRLRRRLQERRPIPLRSWARRFGVEERALIAPAREALTQVAREIHGVLLLRPGASAAAIDSACRALTPERPQPARAWTEEVLAGAERELVSLRSTRTHRELVNQFRAALGVPGRGLRWRDAYVAEHDDTGLSFALGGRHGERLRLLVTAPEATPRAYAVTRRFAISYSTAPARPSPAALEFMAELVRELRRVEADSSS